jgi:NAD-dependent SIR2 family protein deacetylase
VSRYAEVVSAREILANTKVDLINRAASLVDDASAILVVAGAGIGIDSGLPDFRGRQGFWKAYPALAQHGISFTDIASPEAFHRHPRLAWGFYGHRLAMYRAVEPHRGFHILKGWMSRAPGSGGVFTSNVDGHFQKAGFDERRIAECHGSLNHLQCLEDCDVIWPATEFSPQVQDGMLVGELPSCPRCGGLARPNVLMFGDYRWISRRTDEQERRLDQWLAGVERLLVIEIGAGSAIPTARNFSARMVIEHDALVIRINPDESTIHGHSRHVSLPMGALAALQAIDQRLSAS